MKDHDAIPSQAATPRHAPVPDLGRSLDGPAQALPPALAVELAHHYGRDFGDVRIHADADAGMSALALGAEAYTVGRDIVFAPGAYRPDSTAGRRLVAHEAAHVVQQGAQPARGGDLRLDAGEGAAEREAEQAGAAFGQPRAAGAHHLQPRGGGAVVQRSLFGSILGGVLGAGAGIALGAFFGPLGMVVGGIAGLVAGAVIGDQASRRSRSLSGTEKTYLYEIFRDSVDYDDVTITRGSAFSAGAARTIGNTINLQDEQFTGDTMDLSDDGMLVLAHEMGHVWQYQNGGLDYIPSSLIPQLRAAITGGDRNAAYDWRSAVRNHVDWADWNAEQQAECISDYNEALRRLRANAYTADARRAQRRLEDIQTVSLAEPFIERVRAGTGAPGSRRHGASAPADEGGAP
ncbi:eCIS core domain-containing protein [Pseudoxanthomonas sp. 10H]|uniref:eCIS core domain-containing protein n=1 Tax=Pseudoxanthomonas sp. 10H TaxID=3242729 RepID=UPI003558409B